MINTVDILSSVVGSLSYITSCEYINYNTTTDESMVSIIIDDECLGIFIGQRLTINDFQESFVKKIINENTIVINGRHLGISNVVIHSPNFYHGTILDVNNELVDMPWQFKFPMIYLHERYTETYYTENNIFSHSGKYKIHVLTQGDFNEWLINDYKTNAIDPMNLLANKFVNQLRKTKGIKIGDSHSRTNKTRFATYIDSKGETQQEMQDTMTGVELNIELSFHNNIICNC
jgi:hypothetical protein